MVDLESREILHTYVPSTSDLQSFSRCGAPTPFWTCHVFFWRGELKTMTDDGLEEWKRKRDERRAKLFAVPLPRKCL